VPHEMSVDEDLNAAALAARNEMRARHLQPEDLAAYAVAGGWFMHPARTLPNNFSEPLPICALASFVLC